MYDIGIGGPNLDDFSNWRQWYLPELSEEDKLSKYELMYGVSEDCTSSCLYNTGLNSNSAYYMTGNFFLCAWATKGDCDMDAETYQCYECARIGGRSSDVQPGVCSHLEYPVDHEVHTDHFQCTGNNDNIKPSIGLINQYCVCYRPNDESITSITMDLSDYTDNLPSINYEPATQQQEDDNEETVNADPVSSNIVYLSQQDFMDGTYRITEPGTYVFTEDVEFNFNAPTDEERDSALFSPNSYEDLWWMPRPDGSQEDKYQGGSTWSGPYQLGFFSGITVECSDVVIDLGGHTVGMSEEFYLQQRFFSIIELAKKNFVSGQGPVDFGAYLSSASNVVIKNGALSRASHHCIHGNGASNIVIDNIHAYNFDVAGIQLNGFDNIEITNCDIGPSSNPPVNGRYLHARTLLRRYKHLADNYGDKQLLFANRNYDDDENAPQYVREYVDELIEQMDMVYGYVINHGDVEYAADTEENDEYPRWLRAKELFLNPSPYLHGDGGVVYGILLNSRGGAVMGFGNAPSKSTNAVIENVEIHDLAISPVEKLKFKTDPVGGATRGPVADVFDMIKVSDKWGDFDDVLEAKYVGTAYSDVQILMSEFEESWYVLDHTCFDQGIRDWTIRGVPFVEETIHGGCNTDIQLHINKGVIGMRVDNVVGFEVNNINIHDLINTGNLGHETICGAYEQGNAHQDPLITAGYTGTEGYGITITQSTDGSVSGAVIDSIETYYGNCNGIALFKDSVVTFNDISVSNIVAGSQLQLTDLRPYQNYLPNKIPRACSVFDNNYNTQYTIGEDGISAHDVNGYLVCSVQDNNLIGDCDAAENCVGKYDAPYFDRLASQYSTNADSDAYIAFVENQSVKAVPMDYVSWTVGFVVLCVLAAFVVYYRRAINHYPQLLMMKSMHCDKIAIDTDRSEYTPLLD